jgi:hypothetical protein
MAVKRVAPEIVPVQLDQVEGPHEHVCIMPAIADTIERGDPVGTARNCFPRCGGPHCLTGIVVDEGVILQSHQNVAHWGDVTIVEDGNIATGAAIAA